MTRVHAKPHIAAVTYKHSAWNLAEVQFITQPVHVILMTTATAPPIALGAFMSSPQPAFIRAVRFHARPKALVEICLAHLEVITVRHDRAIGVAASKRRA